MKKVEAQTVGSGLGEPRTAEKSAEAASELGLKAGIEAGGLERTGDMDRVAEWLGAGRPGGELRNGRRSWIQHTTTHPARSQSRKAMMR